MGVTLQKSFFLFVKQARPLECTLFPKAFSGVLFVNYTERYFQKNKNIRQLGRACLIIFSIDSNEQFIFSVNEHILT